MSQALAAGSDSDEVLSPYRSLTPSNGAAQPAESSAQGGQVTVSEQRRCRIVINTSDVRFLTLKSGSLLSLVVDDLTIPARVNRTESGRMYASLRKRDCERNLIGVKVSLSSEPLQQRLPSTRPTVSSSAESNTGIVDSDAPGEASSEVASDVGPVSVRRLPNDGPQFVLGIQRLSARKTDFSLTQYNTRLTYEWLLGGQKSSRRQANGFALGAGLTIDGFGRDYNDKPSTDFVSSMLLRAGFRTSTRTVGFTLASTLKYGYFNSYTTEVCQDDVCSTYKKTKTFDSETPVVFGLDAQIDFSVSNNLRLVLLPAYTLGSTERSFIGENFYLYEILTGVLIFI